MKLGWALDHNVPDAVERELVRAADDQGLDSVWTMENHHLRDGVTTAAVTLERTPRIRVVMGTLSPSFRHPVEIGLTMANLVRMYPGRCALNLGSGMAETLVRLGCPTEHPLGRLREAIEIIRRLFSGERFAFEGDYYHIERHHLSGDPLETPPIYISAMGPRLISLAAEVADGINLPLASSPEYIAESAARFTASSKAAGRDRTGQLISAEVLVQIEDGKMDLSGVRRLLGFHFSSKQFEKVAAPSGLQIDHAAIRQAFLDRAFHRLETYIPDSTVRTFTAVGSLDEVVSRLRAYLAAGPDMIVVYTAGTPEQRMQTMSALAQAWAAIQA
ncbi:MAG TPA: LLM class flavin-dependent oxidoreductase [Candidatus Dormibacteraeota bacterium]